MCLNFTIMFALCFTIGLPHGLRTFPNCRVKLCSHSLRAILLQMPSPWGFNSHFLVFLKSNCVDGMTFYFLFFSTIAFHSLIIPIIRQFTKHDTPFQHMFMYLWYLVQILSFLYSFICVLMHLLGLCIVAHHE
jgi:hypothetical protein